MPLLNDIRRFFSRSGKHTGPVNYDLTGMHTPNASDDASGPATVEIETRPSANAMTSSRSSSGGGSAQKEVLQLVRKVSEHLDDQSTRTERLMGMLDKLPEALDAIPQLNQQNQRLLTLIGEQFDHARERDQALNAALSRLGDGTASQREVLDLLQQQIEAGNQTAAHVAEHLGSLQSALDRLADSNTRSAQMVTDMAQATRRQESALLEQLQKSQRWLFIVLGAIGAVTITALVIALVAFLN